MTVAAEGVVQPMCRDQERTTAHSDQDFYLVGRELVSKVSAKEYTGQSAKHKNDDAGTLMYSIAIKDGDCAQKRYSQSKSSMRPLFAW